MELAYFLLLKITSIGHCYYQYLINLNSSCQLVSGCGTECGTITASTNYLINKIFCSTGLPLTSAGQVYSTLFTLTLSSALLLVNSATLRIFLKKIQSQGSNPRQLGQEGSMLYIVITLVSVEYKDCWNFRQK